MKRRVMRGILQAACWLSASQAAAEPMQQLLRVTYRPVRNAQIAIWVEQEDGEFVRTLRLTEATALRGIGNRPGASQMNSAFRWPYGRREGVLPIWATRRRSAPGAKAFRRVIFQDRISEGHASRSSDDSSAEDYFCLSFELEQSREEALDAVSCASQRTIAVDKGRFLTDADILAGYAEPFEDPQTGQGMMVPLSYDSLYPPRRDVKPCADCLDHPDAAMYGDHAREVMPSIDEVTMATPRGDGERSELFSIPADWSYGAYQLCLEINVEGDYNDNYNDVTYPTPLEPEEMWDRPWAVSSGYPYRGQPSVVYCVPFKVDGQESVFSVAAPVGSAGTWDYRAADFGELHSLAAMSADPASHPGQGVDRLKFLPSGDRLTVEVTAGSFCATRPEGAAATVIKGLAVSPHEDRLRAHQWAVLSFSPKFGEAVVHRFDVRISSEPITNDLEFIRATPAKNATIQADELVVPTDQGSVQIPFGGLNESQHYYLAIRSVDDCDHLGPIAMTDFSTPVQQFVTVSPCFVATAAYGSPLAKEVGVLRRFRDRHLLPNWAGRQVVRGYYRVGERLAKEVERSATLRGLTRAALRPLVRLVRWLDGS